MQRGVGCSRTPEGPCVAVALVSGGDRNKDMGGLLLENDRDFLLYRAGGRRDVEALSASFATHTEVQVSRHVTNSECACNEYYYCGLYQIIDSISSQEEGVDFTYFKLLRIPGQQPLVPQKMVFKHDRTAQESFLSTRQAYKKYHTSQAQAPSERFSFHKPCGSKDGKFEFDLCVICGIDGNGIAIYYCESCSQNGREVVVHPSCIQRNELHWLSLGENHHWRCPECKQNRQRPPEGLLFEDFTPSQQQSLQSPAAHVTVPDDRLDLPGPSTLSNSSTGKRAHAQHDPDYVLVPSSSEDDSSEAGSVKNFMPRPPKHLRTLGNTEPRHPDCGRNGRLPRLDARQSSHPLSPGHSSSGTHTTAAANTTPITDATGAATAAMLPSQTEQIPPNTVATPAPAAGALAAPALVAATARLPSWRTKARPAAQTVHTPQPAPASLLKPVPLAAATPEPAPARTDGIPMRQFAPPDASTATVDKALATPAAAIATPTAIMPASAAAIPNSAATRAASASATASSGPASLSEAVGVVNLRLMEVGDSRVITPQQVKGLEGSLSGISDLLELDKGDIKDVLRHKSFGIELSVKQALFMQSYILELKDSDHS